MHDSAAFMPPAAAWPPAASRWQCLACFSACHRPAPSFGRVSCCDPHPLIFLSTLPSCCPLIATSPPSSAWALAATPPAAGPPVQERKAGFQRIPIIGQPGKHASNRLRQSVHQHAASQASTRHGAAAIGIGSTSSRYAHMHATMHAELGRRHGMTASSSPPRQLRQCNSQSAPSGPRSGCRHAPVLCAAPRAPRRGRVGQMGSHLQLSRLHVMLQWHTQ